MSERRESEPIVESAGTRARRRRLALSRLSASAVLTAAVLNPVNVDPSSVAVLDSSNSSASQSTPPEILVGKDGKTTAPNIILVSFTRVANGNLYAPNPFRTPDPLAGFLKEPAFVIPKSRQNMFEKKKPKRRRR